MYLGLFLGLGLAGCATSPDPDASAFPPADFRLVVEDLGDTGGALVVRRRFTVWADGTCIYGRASAQVVDPETKTSLPVFGTLSVYRLFPVNTRLLARKLHKRRFMELKLDPVEQSAKGDALRIFCQMFDRRNQLTPSGQIYGPLVGILNVVNNHLPAGERFALAGLSGDPDPVTLSGVPLPSDSVPGALGAFRDLLAERPQDPDLLLDAFALACAAGDQRFASELLDRFRALPESALPESALPTGMPRLSADVLVRMLPR